MIDRLLSIVIVCLCLSNCQTSKGNIGNVQSFDAPVVEAKWIRNGEPIEFEVEFWSPADGIENLLDSEVYLVGEYRGAQFFVDKQDVRPYNRLYTKFERNKFRYFLLQKKQQQQ
ncbi:MAG: hypothetical protein Q7S13_01100 [Candidatus Omnitrophota bacterium]|nr:hypothetical protein [Candidatus Omnitrophota bacterium]